MSDYFKEEHLGKVLEHKLGFHVTIIRLDPQEGSESMWGAARAWGRYLHVQTGDLRVDSFHANEFKDFALEEEVPFDD